MKYNHVAVAKSAVILQERRLLRCKSHGHKMIACILTASRILFSGIMACMPYPSVAFTILYCLGGLSDVLDGQVARKTHTVSRMGEILDTVADFVFLTVAAIKIYSFIDIPLWIEIWIFCIALCKAGCILTGFVIRKKFFMPHTVANKITGCILFCLGILIGFTDILIPAVVSCAAATVAALQECSMHFKSVRRG